MGSFISSAANSILANYTGVSNQQKDAQNGAIGSGSTDAANANETYAWAKDQGNAGIDTAGGVAKQEMGLADASQNNAVGNWKQYQSTFAPVNSQVATDAMNYDSPDQMARVRQEAAGNANEAFDTAMASRNAGLTRMGVNPNSGAFADPNATSLARAQAVAGSENTATANRQDTAIGLRSNAAGLGLNVNAAGNQDAGLAVQAGIAATSNTNAANMAASTMRGNPTQWASAGIQGFNSGGSLANQLYGQQMTRWGQGEQNGIGFAKLSDENAKEEKSDVDEDRVLAGLKRITVKAWKYKEGRGDSGRHIGAMAQDLHREFGDRVAPGGKMVDLMSMHGLAMAGIRALAQQVDHLSAGLAKLQPSGA